MQQTETLKLNLIEGTDTVDPAPINENMETLETETQAIREEMTSANTALTTSLTALAADLGSGEKNCRIAWGSYEGDWTYGSDNPITLTFDFKPVMVVCYSAGESGEEFHLIRPSTKISGWQSTLSTEDNKLTVATWSDNSVSWYASTSGPMYNRGYTYVYVALGVAE